MYLIFAKDREGKKTGQVPPAESRRMVQAGGGVPLYWPRSFPPEQGGTAVPRYRRRSLLEEPMRTAERSAAEAGWYHVFTSLTAQTVGDFFICH